MTKKDILDDADVEDAPEANDAQLAAVTTAIKLYETTARALEDANAKAAKAKEAFDQVMMTTLPEALSAAGFAPPTKTMISGRRIEFTNTVSASIPAAHQKAAFEFLEAEGSGDIIKHEVKINFGRAEQKFFEKFLADLKKRKVPVKAEIKDSVHSGTLGAWVRERMASGAFVPNDLLGVFVRRYATVKPATDAAL